MEVRRQHTARASGRWAVWGMGWIWLMAGCATPSYIDPKDPLLTGYRSQAPSELRHMASDMKEAAPHKEAFEQFLVESRTTKNDDLSYRDLLVQDHERKLKIEAMEGLLTSTEKNRKLDLYLQLADAHRERHDFLYRSATSRYLLAIEGKIATPQGAQPTLQLEEAQAELLKSADTLRSLVRDFPNHEKTKELLFTLARTLGRVGNDNASYYYTMYLKHKPTDAALAEMWTAQGDEAFDRGEPKAAIELYKKAINLKGTPAYPFAVYKLGWAYILTGIKDPTQAITVKNKAHAAFALVVKLSGQKDAKALKNLHAETLYDQCLWWAQTGDMDAIAVDNYLKAQQHSDLYPTYLVLRARTLASEKKYEQAIDLYNKLLSTTKPTPAWVNYYAQLVELYYSTGMDNNVYKAIEQWHVNLTATEGPWAEMFGRTPEEKTKSQTMFEAALSTYTALYLDKVQKDASTAHLAITDKLLRLKINTMPRDAKLAESHFNLGLILFQKNDLDTAQKEFQTAFDLAAPTDKLRIDSSYNRLITLVRVEEIAQQAGSKAADSCAPPAVAVQGADKQAAKSKEPPVGLAESKKQLVEALDRYTSLVGEDKRAELLPLMFDCAMIAMSCGLKDEALSRLEAVLLASPKSQQGKSAFSSIFSYLIDQNKWDDVAMRAEKYLKSDKLKGKGFDPLLNGLLAQANEQKAKPPAAAK